MKGASPSFTVIVTLAAALYYQTAVGAISCHLHAPDDYTPFSKQTLIIPAVGTAADCDRYNRQRFDSRGRCHCVEDPAISDGLAPATDFQPLEPPDQLP